MKNHAKLTAAVLLAALFSIFAASCASADAFDKVLDRWRKSQYFQSDMDGNLTITCTYYSAEYVEAYVQSEAEKNLWTKQETEDFKYRFLSTLRLNETIPIYIEFINNGPSMHPGPFDIMVALRIKNKTYKPIDYHINPSTTTNASTSDSRARKTDSYSSRDTTRRQAKIYLKV